MMDPWLFWKLGLDSEEYELVRQSLEGCAPVTPMVGEREDECEPLAA